MGRGLSNDELRIPGLGDSSQPDSVVTDPQLLEALHEAVFEWVGPRLRQLPWREVRDPWHILVSEVMLQQTSVNRVQGKWQAFIERFPTPHDCARAELADVLRIWQGLGYPRRARNLHRAAHEIVSGFDGLVPRSMEDLLALPGVGPYTARAVLAFAFEVDAAVVDTNVMRVLRRWSGRTLTSREAQELADWMLPEGEAWLWNQAVMDIGATVCGPRPECHGCPLETTCRWRSSGPDPAESVTRQGRFEGSDRQARGRLMKTLVQGSVAVDEVAETMDRPIDVALRLLGDLIDEGLVRRIDDHVVL